MADTNTPRLFQEMDPTCKFKKWEVDGAECKKPHCLIGFFECQWIDNCIPCPLRWQWGEWNGWDDITPAEKIAIVKIAKEVIETLASSRGISIPEVSTIFDLLDATRILQEEIEGSQTTTDTLDSIAATLERLSAIEEETQGTD